METVRHSYSFIDSVSFVVNHKKGLFINKLHRDKIATYFKNQGIATKKSTVKNQQLHPEYINDFEGVYNTGFGNSDYLMFHKVLYTLTL